MLMEETYGDGDAGCYLVGVRRDDPFRSNVSFPPGGQERLGLAISSIGGRGGCPTKQLSNRIDRRVGRVWEWLLEDFASPKA
ncbi:hypothetical protein BHE90_017524 [Fusarium euwallaceae]|uniref:Uncharacterized protein n=1 Tax=Fusarium euwallaceae TaxID=1147111 RepID=A0A430KX80_9HYPO|nr:hypothetical protein BHE90_017524 [Fusarium euwallaceae]